MRAVARSSKEPASTHRPPSSAEGFQRSRDWIDDPIVADAMLCNPAHCLFHAHSGELPPDFMPLVAGAIAHSWWGDQLLALPVCIELLDRTCPTFEHIVAFQL